METKLLQLLNDANAPLFLFEKILGWAMVAKSKGYNFKPKRTTRHAQVQFLQRWLGSVNARPYQHQVHLPTLQSPPVLVKEVEVTCFDFQTQLLSLLCEPSLVSDMAGLDVNPDNPFSKYESNHLSCFNSGQWYHDAYDHIITDPNTELFVPIILAIDEAALNNSGRHTCCPVMMTTSLFGQSLRNRSTSWRPLGFVFDMLAIESKAEQSVQSTDLKHSRAHALYRAIFERLYPLDNGLETMPWTELCLGGYKKTVRIKPQLALIIGDIQGGDKIACSSIHYGNKMRRLCRRCDISGANSGNPYAKCSPIVMSNIINLVASNNTEALNAMNQYNVQSAFFDFRYGGCPYGIFVAACPIEPLHSLENGLMLHMMKILFLEILSKSGRAQLDHLAKSFCAQPRQRFMSAGTNKEMPRLLWKDGITNLTDLSGANKTGIFFTIVVLSLTADGEAFFNQHLGSREKTQQMRYVFQLVLCYWQWLKQERFWARGDTVARYNARKAIQTMLAKLKRLWPRGQGQGWDLAKFHEQLHVPDDIERNGAPRNYDTKCTEHNHIYFVKKPAERTQKIRATMDKHIGLRIYEKNLINLAMIRMSPSTTCIHHEPPTETTPNIGMMSNQAATATLFLTWVNDNVDVEVKWKNNQAYTLPHPVVSLLQSAYQEDLKDSDQTKTLLYFTELTRHGDHIRGHPNYRQSGQPWFDWVMFRWEKSQSDRAIVKPDCHAPHLDASYQPKKHLYAPGQILGFILDEDSIYVVARTCKYNHERSSVFTTKWQAEFAWNRRKNQVPYLAFLPCESIVRHCLMIPSDRTYETFNEVWDPLLWSNEFV
jgi:hypothetical protein